jgi:hypothetical protein
MFAGADTRILELVFCDIGSSLPIYGTSNAKLKYQEGKIVNGLAASVGIGDHS